MSEIYGSFVSQKINKVRWKPQELIPNMFISGSWDDVDNTIKLWIFKSNEKREVDVTPKQISSFHVQGDVTQLKFIDNNTFVASTSRGFIHLFSIEGDSINSKLRHLSKWLCHLLSKPYACSDIACLGKSVVSVGEDGRMVAIDLNSGKITSVTECYDYCTIRCVDYYNEKEVINGNCRGQIKMWDVINRTKEPQLTFMLSGPQIGCTRIVHHPNQKHIVLSGFDDGSIAVWDLRNVKFPVTLFDAHSKAVSDLAFHQDRPEHLFSSSVNGQFWHWDATKAMHHDLEIQSFNLNNTMESMNLNTCPWVREDMKSKITVYNLIQDFPFPINGFDIYKNSLICGTDNEAIYVLRNVQI